MGFKNSFHYILVSLALFSLVGFATNGVAADKKECPKLSFRGQLVVAKATGLLGQKKYAEAIAVLDEYQKKGSDEKGGCHPDIYLCYGNCRLMQKQFEAAEKAYKKALKRYSGHSTAWMNLARAHYEQKEYGEAADAFVKAYETAEKKEAATLSYGATSYLMAGQEERSISVFERLFREHPENIQLDWKEHYAHALLSADQARKALPVMEELVRLLEGEKRQRWQEILLYQYLDLKMMNKALSFVRELTRENPTYAKWWKGLAHVSLNMERTREALSAMTIYAWLTPLKEEEKKLLADLHMQVGIPRQAVTYYKDLLGGESDLRILKNMVTAYRQLDKPKEALKCLDNCELTEKDPKLLHLKGDILYGLKEYKPAAEVFRCAAQSPKKQKDRDVGRAWLMAGYSAWQGEDLASARKFFRRSLKYKRFKKSSLAALKQLEQEL